MRAFHVIAICAAVVLALASPPTAFAQKECTATLKRWAMLPSKTLLKPPRAAGAFFEVSGKYAGPGNKIVTKVGSLKHCSGSNPTRCTDAQAPLSGQPIQGFSGIRAINNAAGKPTDTFYVLTDNGFGSKINSPDAMLFWSRVSVDWARKSVKVLESTFMRDPNRVHPYVLRSEPGKPGKNFLTGSDMDLESIQIIGKSVFIAEEFGPWLMEFSTKGVLKAVYDIPLNSTHKIMSPDHPSVSLPNPNGALPASVNLPRSRGFEGMAQSPDGRYLYPLLEGPVYDQGAKKYEMVGDREYLRLFKFNVASRAFEGEPMKYVLEQNGNAIGDFNMVDNRFGMIIERDSGEGNPRLACSRGFNNATCFENPARLKRVYLVDLEVPAGAAVKKVAYIDLMKIADPAGVAGAYGFQGTFDFPFVTIEDVDVYDASTRQIVVGNDNNFPFSMGRALGKADDNELMLLEVPGFFNGGNC